MSGQLSWTREGETLALHGELDQDLLVPLWEARARATEGATIIDLSQTTRVDTAGLALLVHFVALIRRHDPARNKKEILISYLKSSDFFIS